MAGGAPISIVCEHCDRAFTSKEAHGQHVLAKHTGTHTDIKALRGDEVCSVGGCANISSTDSSMVGNWDTGAVCCRVCGVELGSTLLEAHINDGINPSNYFAAVNTANTSQFGSSDESVDLCRNCELCGRKCKDERSYKQHFNYCS